MAKEQLEPLDFIVSRRETLRRWTPPDYDKIQRNILLLENDRVVFRPSPATKELAILTSGWGPGSWKIEFGHAGGISTATRRIAAQDVPRIHAELKALAAEAAGTKAVDRALNADLDKSQPPVTPNWPDVMVDAVVAEQLLAGGHDTPAARAQAERWLAGCCMAICEGLRAATVRGAVCAARGDFTREATNWQTDAGGRRFSKTWEARLKGTPLANS